VRAVRTALRPVSVSGGGIITESSGLARKRVTDKVLRIVSLGAIVWLLVIAIPTAAALRSAAAGAPTHIGAPPLARAFILPTRTPQPTASRELPATEATPPAAPLVEVVAQKTPNPSPTPSPLPPATTTPAASGASSDEPQPVALALGALPTRLRIPAIEIDAAVEPIGLTADHEMDVPAGWESVGWYQYGPRPGQIGNAVLAGHLDTNTGAPGIFWRLDELQPGDTILIDGEDGESLIFQILSLARYPYAEAPREEIFGPAQTARLNLITCSGAWNPQDRVYDHRLVVYAQLVENGGLVENSLGD
jgi:sortase (surface protein transpeptidase)